MNERMEKLEESDNDDDERRKDGWMDGWTVR